MSDLYIDKFVAINPYTRPGAKLARVRKIVVHWTANPGASALNHFKYFNGTAIASKRTASAHIFVDPNEAYCIVPLNEVAYHANDGKYRGISALKPNANHCSIGVEMCVEKDGSIAPATVEHTAKIVAELCRKYGLGADDIVRHYDITRKNCPAPWVAKSAAFTAFKAQVSALLKGGVKVAGEKAKPQSVSTFAKEAQAWAKASGISDGSNPQEPITRQEAWVMLHRLAQKFEKGAK